MIKAVIIGSTGYAGDELVRILLAHKDVEIKWYGSRSYIDKKYASVYQNLLSVQDTAQGAYDAAYYWCKYFEIPANLEYNSQMRADLAMNLYYPKTLGTQKETEEETEIDDVSAASVTFPTFFDLLEKLEK